MTSGQIVTFYSYKGGSGRTMALANVAWILASNGYRVLVVDWDLESPGLHRFFHPFLSDPQLHASEGVIDLIREFAAAVVQDGHQQQAPSADVRRYAVSPDWRFGEGGELDLLPAGRQGPAYSATVSTFDWPSFYDRLGGAAFLARLRDNMRELYDFVLVDSRTGLSDSAGICTVLLPDTVVNCFTLSTQSIDGAAAVARSIRSQRGTNPVRILPVPMRVEDGEKSKLDAGRDHAWLRFAEFLDNRDPDAMSRYWADVEIPYKVFYAYEEILAVFGDRPRQPATLLAAYHRLATEVSGNRNLAEVPTLDEPSRRFWLAKFERTRPRAMLRVLVSHAAEDRMWAEWIAGVLGEVGLPSVLRDAATTDTEGTDPPADLVAVLLSAAYRVPAESEEWLRRAAAAERGRPTVLPISLDGTSPPVEFERFAVLELSGMPAERARAALLTTLNWPVGEPSPPGAEGGVQPRYPGNPPPVQRVPFLRNESFTGRRQVLTDIRDHFAGRSGATTRLALTGLGGVGKTQIATEYAYRFAADYDVVWWVPAAQSSMVRASLVGLADELRVPATDTTAERIRLLLEALRQGRPHRRWLIIFDSVRDVEELSGVLPDGPGHVLITSRSPMWGAQAHVIEVEPFGRDESVELLRRRLPAISPADADRVAERLGDLPLAIEQAGSWLATTAMPIDRYLTLVEHQLSRVLAENPPAGYERAGAITWLLSLDGLREESPAAAHLVELIAFFGPEPIPASLLYGRELREVVAGDDPALRDDIAFGRLVTDVRRYALASHDEVHKSMQMHRLVLAVVRESLPSEAATARRAQVHRILVDAAPLDSDSPETWPEWARFWPHVVTSGALHATDRQTRELVLSVVRYLFRRSDFAGSAELAESAVREWTPLPPADDVQVLIAKVFLANALRAGASDYPQALRLSEEAYEGLMATVGPANQYSILCMAGLAADLWLAGRDFARARSLLDEALRQSIALFDAEHRRTFRAMNNVAVHLENTGDYSEAHRLHGLAHAGRRRTLTEQHPDTLYSAISLGRVLRFTGDYRSSRRLLEAALGGCQTVLGLGNSATLRATIELSATLRRLGEPDAARRLGREALAVYVETRPPDHFDRLACLNTLALTYSALGNQAEALELAQECADRHRDRFGPAHPLALATLANLATVLRRNGEIDSARQEAERALSVLLERFGVEYPHALQCSIVAANARFAAGDVEGALELEEPTYARMADTLGDAHPERLIAGCNLAATRDALGRFDGLAALRDELHGKAVRVLGPDHPITAAIAAEERADCEIDLAQF